MQEESSSRIGVKHEKVYDIAVSEYAQHNIRLLPQTPERRNPGLQPGHVGDFRIVITG
jgi:hypothetical protein